MVAPVPRDTQQGNAGSPVSSHLAIDLAAGGVHEVQPFLDFSFTTTTASLENRLKVSVIVGKRRHDARRPPGSPV